MNRSNQTIAWKIAYEIMSHNEETLLLAMLHPCDEQYECLSTIRHLGDNDTSSQMLINLKGTSILAGNSSDNLLSPYPELYERDKSSLLSEIAGRCGYRLTTTGMRQLYAVKFLMELVANYLESRLYITAAWYDGSYSCHLSQDAKSFPHYVHKGNKERSLHLPWWIVSSAGQAIAMCNIGTNELTTLDGSRFNLEYDAKKAETAIESQIKIAQIRETANEALVLIRGNQEWKSRYKGYAGEILANFDNITSVRKSFREWNPFKFYLNVSNAKKASGRISFDVRYLGQTVAELIWKKDKNCGGLFLHTKVNGKKYDVTNSRDFDCSIHLNMAEWAGHDAKVFRNFFKNRKPIRNVGGKGTEEHRIESLLLSEFSKSKSKEKALPYIQPVKIARVRFPMPTPLGASDHKALKYSGVRGGGIDILARAGKAGSSAKLCIIELKDENRQEEPATEVIKQAVAYAVFIRELLRSDAGTEWWRLFGFGSQLPKKLTLFAVCAMPSNGNDDHSFAEAEINIEEDSIRLHYLFFTEKHNKVICIDTSLN